MIEIKNHCEEIITMTEDESFLRFEIEGYTPGTIDYSNLAGWDCGDPAIIETVRVYLNIVSKMEIELPSDISDCIFRLFEDEFYGKMSLKYKDRG